jgi:hypothetical protein
MSPNAQEQTGAEDAAAGPQRGALPLGPRWAREEPEGGPEAQLYRLLALSGQLAQAAADEERSPAERREALRAARALLPAAERAFAAWESDAFYQARGLLTSALAIDVERAACDLREASAWLADAGASLPAASREGGGGPRAARPAPPATRGSLDKASTG